MQTERETHQRQPNTRLDVATEAANIPEDMEQRAERLKQLNPLLGISLIPVGLLLMLKPGPPPGSPIVLLGMLIVAPHLPGFGSLDRWLQRRMPWVREDAIEYLDDFVHVQEFATARFRSDLRKRYPAIAST